MPGLLDYLYPKGWSGGLLGYGNAVADQAQIDQERAGLLSAGLPGQAIMHRPMDNPMGFAMGTSNIGGPIRAYHGSPHDFDKFDLSKIGTGEGAQAYGHGLYFAENEAVARGYADALARPKLDLGNGQVIPQQRAPNRVNARTVSAVDDPVMQNVMSAIQANRGDIRAALRGIEGDARQAFDMPDEIDLLRHWVENPKAAPRFDKGQTMYEVNLHADPNKFLDWDKPLSGQGARIDMAMGDLLDASGLSNAERNYVLNNKTGQDAVRRIAKPSFPIRDDPAQPWRGSGATSLEEALAMVGGDKGRVNTVLTPDSAYTSDALSRAGIPGIKYLDAGSRGAGDGTRNYVVFDPKIIEIVRKYGLGALGLTGLLGAQEGEQGQ